MFIGFTDLVMTAVLHSQGLIIELNPLMKPLIEHSEWSFAFVKGLTLLAAWFVMWKHSRVNLAFVRRMALIGSGVYLVVWTVWFVIGSITVG